VLAAFWTLVLEGSNGSFHGCDCTITQFLSSSTMSKPL
jgi:hypothetical protein